jgi:hypothetical protein
VPHAVEKLKVAIWDLVVQDVRHFLNGDRILSRPYDVNREVGVAKRADPAVPKLVALVDVARDRGEDRTAIASHEPLSPWGPL